MMNEAAQMIEPIEPMGNWSTANATTIVAWKEGDAYVATAGMAWGVTGSGPTSEAAVRDLLDDAVQHYRETALLGPERVVPRLWRQQAALRAFLEAHGVTP